MFATLAPCRAKAVDLSERGADAALGGDDAALVGHHRALDRAEHRDLLVGMVVEAGADHGADGAALARRHEGEVLAAAGEDEVGDAISYPSPISARLLLIRIPIAPEFRVLGT
jgi:hypothetical protein